MMTSETAEYKALERFVTADKRYRHFVYLLTFAAFIFLLFFFYKLSNDIVAKEVAALQASTRKSTETRLTISRETMRYNTCMLLLPVDARTPKAQANCFKIADLPGGLSRSDFIPITQADVSAAVAAATQATTSHNFDSSNNSAQPSSSNNKVSRKQAQSKTPQPSQPKPKPTPQPQPGGNGNGIPVVSPILNLVRGLLK